MSQFKVPTKSEVNENNQAIFGQLEFRSWFCSKSICIPC